MQPYAEYPFKIGRELTTGCVLLHHIITNMQSSELSCRNQVHTEAMKCLQEIDSKAPWCQHKLCADALQCAAVDHYSCYQDCARTLDCGIGMIVH